MTNDELRFNDSLPALLTASECAARYLITETKWGHLTNNRLAPAPVMFGRCSSTRRWLAHELLAWEANGCEELRNDCEPAGETRMRLRS